MARRAKPNNRTSLRFISPDDSAIGLGEEAMKDGWKLYTETLNEEHLKVDPNGAPSYYYLKCLSLDAQQRLFAVLATDESDDRSFMERFSAPEARAEIRFFLENFLTGCVYHEEILEVTAQGETKTKAFVWEPGTPRPEGLVESILADQILAFNLFMFASGASRLSETEKKQ